MLYAIVKFIAITKEEGKEEKGRRRRRRRPCFGQQSHWQKKVSFFVPYVIVCFHPIAANGIDVIHGCGGQEGGEVGGQQEGGGHQGGGQQ